MSEIENLLDNEKIINFFRLLHLWLHEKERKELENYLKDNKIKLEDMNMKDKVELVLKDAQGNIKQIIN